jgi:hypothetical protein
VLSESEITVSGPDGRELIPKRFLQVNSPFGVPVLSADQDVLGFSAITLASSRLTNKQEQR